MDSIKHTMNSPIPKFFKRRNYIKMTSIQKSLVASISLLLPSLGLAGTTCPDISFLDLGKLRYDGEVSKHNKVWQIYDGNSRQSVSYLFQTLKEIQAELGEFHGKYVGFCSLYPNQLPREGDFQWMGAKAMTDMAEGLNLPKQTESTMPKEWSFSLCGFELSRTLHDVCEYHWNIQVDESRNPDLLEGVSGTILLF
jgi:hypothetical protein